MENKGKTILGLDLGTNSIGWALIEQNFENKEGRILGMGTRIIPMTQDIKDEFGKGNTVSQTAERTKYRSVRRLRERHLLRRERLHRVLNVLDFLPNHYASQIDFSKYLGKFKEGTEPKLAYKDNEFIFKESFQEMLEDFKIHQPEIVANDKLVPFDWTIYYLRKKALSSKIAKEELAWIILNFNQKRGYYQLRGEEEIEDQNKLVEFYSFKIIDVIADEETNRRGETWYSLYLENGWIYRRSSKVPLFDWKDKVRDFIVTTELNDDGTVKKDKEGNERRSFRAPKEDDWTLIKKKTEQEIDNSKKTVGTYIYETLLRNPNQKIRGKLVRTIERQFYKDELKLILQKQIELQPELFTDQKLAEAARELYKNNKAHQTSLLSKDFIHLFINDIIFYQRPLRSQKSLINRCSLEYRLRKIQELDDEGNRKPNVFEKDKYGNEIQIKEYLRAIPKSNPYYQEFRIWQWISNLRIYRLEDDKEVTAEFLSTKEDIEVLFDFLITQKEVDHKDVLNHLLAPTIRAKYPNAKASALRKEIRKELSKYRWNYVYDDLKNESKKYQMNETGYEIRRRLDNIENLSSDFLTKEIEQNLWHIIYSVTDKIEFEKALKTFAKKHNLNEDSFLENFKNFKPFDSEYGAFSEKAIKKLLPLLRTGKYWDWSKIDRQTQKRIEKIITGEYDEKIKNRVREKSVHLQDENDFQGLQLWLAQYIVYDRHSESEIAERWNSISSLEKFIQEFKQHSLRNPIVEQVVTETLRVVRDIWKFHGSGKEGFFDEIHIELSREMKNTAEQRKRLTTIVTENENTNQRIQLMLAELLNDNQIENVRPYSPMQQEILKIYEDGVLKSGIEIPDDIAKISTSARPTKAEFQRYKLWLEQKYMSPYTGQPISLSKLFTTDYQIEHVIPQSRFFDDSFSNKVICESAVNKLKDNLLGYEFIQKHKGQIVELGYGKSARIFNETEYKNFIEEHYSNNRTKRNKLLMDELPESMTTRQLNDTRYISKYISSILSNIVRAEEKDDGVNSKNLLPGNGRVTARLRQDWGLNDVWNELILPRFERLNELTQTSQFTSKNSNGKTIPTVPLELSKGFQKKRIDHRHHALDALVIACATRDHINLLNNQSAKSEKSRFDLQHKLRKKGNWIDKNGKERNKFLDFIKPWPTFTQDAKNSLESIVVSFKQNLRVINKASNKYWKYVERNGEMKKELVRQTRGDSWAIRKPMHKEYVYGRVALNRIKPSKGKSITAIRERIDSSFNFKKIESITDENIQNILRAWLKQDRFKELNSSGEVFYNQELAFSPEGLEEMNKDIKKFNNGKDHKPIYKARVFELGNRFRVGQTGNKKRKFVEAAQGTNLFYGIYENNEGKRSFETIPLNVVIERQKQGLSPVPEVNEKGHNLLFHLSPNDLVYVPTIEELEIIGKINFNDISEDQSNRLYNVNDFSTTCYFTPNRFAKNIAPKEVDLSIKKNKLSGSYDHKTASLEGSQIKDICIKLKIDRLGNISKI